MLISRYIYIKLAKAGATENFLPHPPHITSLKVINQNKKKTLRQNIFHYVAWKKKNRKG